MPAKRWLLGLLGALALTFLPALARTSYAHAVLVRSEPSANAKLSESPSEIRLWFAEPIEPDYSSIQLQDETGKIVTTPPSQVDPDDNQQMALVPGDLPPGLYTVVWRNASAADGHAIAGTFPFIIGQGDITSASSSTSSPDLTLFNVLSRWFNFIGVALAVGTIAFIAFVWQPVMREIVPFAPRSLWVMVWLGWLFAGIGAVLVLLNQSAILLNQPVGEVLYANSLGHIVSTTRFGAVWLARMGFWLVMGALLLFARRSTLVAWMATACGLLMLIPISMFSHAAVGNDIGLSVATDWLHLAMMSLWTGGLAQFLVAIPLVRKLAQPAAPIVGKLVVNFSNCARVAVIALVITGLYATWNLVTTWDGLTTTLYGQLLTLKLFFALALLVVAAINLLWTPRGLMAGQSIWVWRLRILIISEVALLCAILLVVGVMTSISPARTEIAQRQVAAVTPPVPQQESMLMMNTDVDDLHIQFMLAPGWVGENTFTVALKDKAGDPITNAKLIRLRFENETQKTAESELQIRPQGETKDGVYTIEGANVSTVGDWRVRMTIQRPKEYDSVVDFALRVSAAPPPPTPPAAPVIEESPVLPYRTPVLLGVGILALLAGLYCLIGQRKQPWQGASWMAALLVVLGVAFLVAGVLT